MMKVPEKSSKHELDDPRIVQIYFDVALGANHKSLGCIIFSFGKFSQRGMF